MRDLIGDVQLNNNEDQDNLSSFPGYGLKELRAEGGQGKGRWTGIYTQGPNTYYIKRALRRADNVAEVVASRVLEVVIGNQAVPYSFVRNSNDGENYVVSQFRAGFESLETRVRNAPGGKGKGWLGANPYRESNKNRIYKAVPKALRLDLARVLAASSWQGDNDCQVANICFFDERGPDGVIRKRMGKFDNGWALAGLCKKKHNGVRLFETKSFFGNRATHKHAGLPTNHFNDYPKIINSRHFLRALDEVVQKADNALLNNQGNFVTRALREISDHYNANPAEKRKAFQEFAKHLGLSLPRRLTRSNEIRNFIEGKLIERLKERADSMALVRALLNIKLKVKNRSVSETDLEALRRVINQRFEGKSVGSFMPSDFKPSVRKLLSRALSLMGRGTDRALVSFIRGLDNPNRVIPAARENRRGAFSLTYSFDAARGCRQALKRKVDSEREVREAAQKRPRLG